jgi:hypothetical protein
MCLRSGATCRNPSLRSVVKTDVGAGLRTIHRRKPKVCSIPAGAFLVNRITLRERVDGQHRDEILRRTVAAHGSGPWRWLLMAQRIDPQRADRRDRAAWPGRHSGGRLNLVALRGGKQQEHIGMMWRFKQVLRRKFGHDLAAIQHDDPVRC